MRLSYQIPLITGLAIIATIVVNILAFQYFMGTLFVAYTEEMQANEQKGSFSPEKLRAVLDVSTLSPAKQDEYKKVVNELSTISTSLKNISENPELYIQSGSGAKQVTDGNSTLRTPIVKYESSFANISSLLANLTGWEKGTPEWTLIIGLLTRLLATNIVVLFITLSLYYLWIRRVFAPVHLIIDRLNVYIDSSRFQDIHYKRDNEFTPLVQTINGLYKSLRMQENIRSNFLSDISHEIRTPITAVRCYLEAIEDGMMTLDAKTIPLLQTELSRLTIITEKIMEYEKLTHNDTDEICMENFIMKKEIDALIYEYTPQLEKTRQRIMVSGEDGIIIRMDKNMFIQILHNILSNFIKYSGTGTILTCGYSYEHNTLSIEFSDNGIGIPEDEISLVREKFYRVDKSRTRDIKMSMGIGLSIVDHIVRIHNGSLNITNNVPKGLSITLTIPK